MCHYEMSLLVDGHIPCPEVAQYDDSDDAEQDDQGRQRNETGFEAPY